MNDEIKINKINKSITFINNGIAFSQFGVADEILDYITNLQQENFKLRENILIHKMSFKSDDKSLEHLINMPTYEELQQENETLKENNQAMQEEMARTWQKYDDCKSRCEKANGIIKKEKENMGYAKYDGCLLLIENIIKNRSDDNE